MKKRIIIPSALLLICLLLVGLLFAVKHYCCMDIYDQTVAERWGDGEGGYVQLSLFISENAKAGMYTVNEIKTKVSERLLAESVTADGENGEVFFDAYSAKSSVTVSRDSKTVQSTAYFTGGDFFRFHSLDMKSGWYYNEYDLMDDYVLINTYAAWQMYGSYDLVGKTVEVSGYPCIICGVFDDSRENKAAEPVIYASYSLLYKIGKEEIPITCYEAVIPEPVKNFGEDVLRQAVNVPEKECELIKNTGRYGFLKNAKEIKNFLSRTDKTNSVIYPSWENNARRCENLAIILTFFILVFSAFPAALLVFAVILLYVKKGVLFGMARDKVLGLFKRR